MNPSILEIINFWEVPVVVNDAITGSLAATFMRTIKHARLCMKIFVLFPLCAFLVGCFNECNETKEKRMVVLLENIDDGVCFIENQRVVIGSASLVARNFLENNSYSAILIVDHEKRFDEKWNEVIELLKTVAKEKKIKISTEYVISDT